MEIPKIPLGLSLEFTVPNQRTSDFKKFARLLGRIFNHARGNRRPLFAWSQQRHHPGGKFDPRDYTKRRTRRLRRWWVSLYNKNELNNVRLSSAEYARLVRPVHEVLDKRGRVISGGWSEKEARRSKRINKLGDEAKVLLRGFYRDRDGVFRLITEPEAQGASAGQT